MKISTNLKDVIESLSDLLTIGESNTIPNHFTDILLNQDIKFSFTSLNKKNYAVAADKVESITINMYQPFLFDIF